VSGALKMSCRFEANAFRREDVAFELDCRAVQADGQCAIDLRVVTFFALLVSLFHKLQALSRGRPIPDVRDRASAQPVSEWDIGRC